MSDPIGSVRARVLGGKSSCRELVDDHLDRAASLSRLNVFRSVDADEARRSAEEIDRKVIAGTAGPLAGFVIALKDNLCVRGKQVSCGSRILESFVSPYDATAVARLKEADAVILGQTNMDEFAMGSSNENSAFGPVLNPLDETRVPGGSSGGSAAAIASRQATAALGSDTGGSVRQPASFCGVVGLKPTYGRVSRFGLVAFASSFDQIGPITQTVEDAAVILGVIAGHDPLDSTSARVPVPDYESELDRGVKGLRVGLPTEYFSSALSGEIREAIMRKVKVLTDHGATVSDVSLPHTEFTVPTYYVLSTAEASSNLARYDGARYGRRAEGVKDLEEMYTRSRSDGFGEEVKRRIMLGTYVLSAGYYDAYYVKGQRVRRLIRQDFENVFRHFDCLVTPTTPGTAFRLGEKLNDPLQMYLTDIYTVSANLAGIPALSIPCGTDTLGLPIGLQIMGKHFDESTLLRVGRFLEQRG